MMLRFSSIYPCGCCPLSAHSSGFRSAHTLAAIVAAPRAHSPATRLARGTCRYLKIAYTLSPINPYRSTAPRYVGTGLRACAPPCRAAAATNASTPRRSKRKFNHARIAPIARPAAHSQRRAKIPTPKAVVKPNVGVSQAIRRTVLAPTNSPSQSSVGFAAISIPFDGKPTYHLAHASDETYRPEDGHQPRA